MKKLLVVVAVLIGLVVIVGIWMAGGYNRLVGLSQGVDQQWAQVQTVYQRRADLIPNLVSTVSGAANFEKSTLTDITKARASVGQVKIDPNTAPSDPQQLQQFQAAQGQLSSALSRLLVVVERYPELKSNQNFLNLQAQLEGTENRIAVERRKFNEAVQAYNTTTRRFPTVLYAGVFGFSPKPYFQAEAGAEKAPTVQFDFGNKPQPAPAPAPEPAPVPAPVPEK
jgi:LemA protein